MDTAVVVFVFALAALVGAGLGAYLAAQPAAEAVRNDVHAAAAAVQQMQPVIEVQAPHVEWPPLLTWLFVLQTILIFILTVSNIVDLLKLGKLYDRKRKPRKQSDTHGTKKKHGRSGRA